MSVLRAAWLTAQNEARLLMKDPMVLLMLLLAPVVIITVAGYSLSAVYGGGVAAMRPLPVVDHDGGALARAVVEGLRDTGATVTMVPDVEQARRLVNRADGPPLALEIRAATTDGVRDGRTMRLVVHTDPAKRIEADALQIRLGELCRRIADDARATAQRKLDAAATRLRDELANVEQTIDGERARLRAVLERERAAAVEDVGRQLAAAVEHVRRDVERQLRTRENEAWASVAGQLSERRAILERLTRDVDALAASRREFADWLARLRELAGRRAADLPPPPAVPPLPSAEDLARLDAPVDRPPTPSLDGLGIRVPPVTLPPIEIEDIPAARIARPDDDLGRVPGSLGLEEVAASPGAPLDVNAFEQYVPGFGITFLLIGMMMGVALTLFDERDWGTLQRLRAGGASLSGVLLGKVFARFLVGVAQMGVLFAVGRALFDISLGPEPAALLLPTVAISLAAAALGLVVPSIARSHDAVMPFGTMLSMAMSAMGGCWWPIGFEPAWMQTVAAVLPTTWAMRAYNDLMIRRAGAAAAVGPFVATVAIGLVLLAVGLYRHQRREG